MPLATSGSSVWVEKGRGVVLHQPVCSVLNGAISLGNERPGSFLYQPVCSVLNCAISLGREWPGRRFAPTGLLNMQVAPQIVINHPPSKFLRPKATSRNTRPSELRTLTVQPCAQLSTLTAPPAYAYCDTSDTKACTQSIDRKHHQRFPAHAGRGRARTCRESHDG